MTLADQMPLTEIGQFGITRKARPDIPEHLHTGIDIRRPMPIYQEDIPIYAIAPGIVISLRSDGPFAQIIIEHRYENIIFWTLYEHVSEINVELHDRVSKQSQIARFFNTAELGKFGWQFNHFHFEVLRVPPLKINPSGDNQKRNFRSYTLECYSEKELDRYFYNPIEFLLSFER